MIALHRAHMATQFPPLPPVSSSRNGQTRINEAQSAHPSSDPWKNSGGWSFLMRAEAEEESPFNLASS